VCGLINIGNSCYINSALQCLSNVPELTEWALQSKSTQRKNHVINVYISMIRKMWSGQYRHIKPHKMKVCIGRSIPFFSDYNQKDSHEFMNSVFNAITTSNSSSIISDLFHIHTQSQVTCITCAECDTADETSNFLPRSVPIMSLSNKNTIRLENLIDDYCQENELSGKYYCSSCKKFSQARQKTIINKPLPRALIILLKRFLFDETHTKNDAFVQYQLQQRNLLSNNDLYELCAVSIHSGNLAGGHYKTIARNYKTTRWYEFDDAYVSEIDSSELLNAIITHHAYVLIYLRQEPI
jgi:ubiquitin carboxyl-terminal hydrolase 8